MNYSFKVIQNSRTIQRCQTHSIRRFTKKIGTINWENGQITVYLRVNYGRYKNNYGKLVNFYNDGEYETKKDLLQAFKAFIDVDKANTENVPARNMLSE